MILTNRIIFSDNGTLTDLSKELNDFRTGTTVIPFNASQDYLYIGADLPWNHRYFEVFSPNSALCTPSVQLYDGNRWNAGVDIIDYTSVGGASLAQSGVIAFAKDKKLGWSRRDTQDIAELSSFTIYNLYWMRMKWSANVTVTTALSYVGHKFSNDQVLATFYPELVLSQTKAQWPVQPKTNWDEQHFEAMNKIIRDLKRNTQITSSNQVLNWETFNEAGARKVAETIFTAYGKDYAPMRDLAEKYYTAAMDMASFDIDQNSNTLIDDDEKFPSLSVVRR